MDLIEVGEMTSKKPRGELNTCILLIIMMICMVDKPSLISTDVSSPFSSNPEALTKNDIDTTGSADNTYCGYLVFSDVNPPKQLNISVGQILNPPEFQRLFNKFRNGSSIVMVDQPETKICKIVICGFTINGGFTTDNGVCKDYWTTKRALTEPYSHRFELSSVRCGCGTGIKDCGEHTCKTKVLDESSGTICAVLYEEYECRECFFKGVPLYHEDVYDTLNSKEILSVYVHPGCNLVRTMGPPLGYDFLPSYDYRLNASQNKQDLTFSRVSDVYKCECGRLVKNGTNIYRSDYTQSVAKPTTIRSTTVSQTTSTPTTAFAVPYSSSNYNADSTEAVSDSRTNQPESINESQTSAKTTNNVLIGVGIFISVSACVIIGITLLVIHKRYKAQQNRDEESYSLSTLKHGEMKAYIKDFIEGSTMEKTKIFIVEKSSLEDPVDCDPRKKSYSVALSLPYDSKYEIQRNHFSFNPEDATCKIGYGAFGMVYKGTLLTYDDRRFRDIAIKTVQGVSDSSGEEFLKSLLNEIKVLSFVGYHENIVYFIGACTVNLRKFEVFLIMDYCSNGNLLKYLQGMPTEKHNIKKDLHGLGKGLMEGYLVDDGSADEQITETISQEYYNLMIQWSMQIASGMEFLSSREVLHIDLAARNVLLTEDLTAKISDFGLSRKLYTAADYKKNRQDVLIPMPWMALETVTERRIDKRYSKKSDVWAYGVTIWEIFSKGNEPYAGMEFQDIFCMLNRGERLSKPQFAPDNVYDTMLSSWAHDPNERPDFKTLKEFFLKIHKNYEKEIKYDL